MSKRTILVVACIVFLGLGWMAGATGPALDELALRNATNLSTIGTIFVIGFLGGLPAQTVTGMMSDRYGPRTVLLAGMVLLGTGTLVFVISQNLVLSLAINVIIGLGFGTVDVGNNILIGEVYAGRVNIMNLLHTFFGIGAIASPAFASLTLKVWDTALPGIWVGGIIMLGIIPFVYRLPVDVGKRTDEEEAAANANHQPFSFRVPLLWLMGGVMLLYVGIELGTGNWTPAYLERSTSLSSSTAALAASGFWFALTGGRVVMVLVGERFTSRQVMWMSVVGSVVGCSVMAVSTGNAALSITGILIAGFWFGPIYPTVMSIVGRTFRTGPGKAMSVAAMMGAIGGGVLSWAQGTILDEVSAAASVIFVGAGSFVMLALWILSVQRIQQRTPATTAEPRTTPAR